MLAATASIASGGLVFRLLKLAGGTSDHGVRPGRVILLLALVGWVPLAILSALDGTLLGSRVAVPFLRDPSVHMRLLVSLPLLVIGEATISRTVQVALAIIRERGLIAAAEQPALEARITRLARERDSRLAEFVILAGTVLTVWLARDTIIAERVLPHPSWLGAADGAPAFSRAGWWYFLVSVCMANIFGFRWVWWIFIWTRFLVGFLRPRLAVSPGHPDDHGGLAFLTLVQAALTPVFAGFAATVAGRLWFEMLYDGASVKSAQVPIVVVLVLAAVVMYLPLLLFLPRMAGLKRRALVRYDLLGQEMVNAFDAAWPGARPEGGTLLDSQHPSAFTDFDTVYASLRRMQPSPLDAKRALASMLMVAVPFLPLLLSAMSPEEILSRMVKLLM